MSYLQFQNPRFMAPISIQATQLQAPMSTNKKVINVKQYLKTTVYQYFKTFNRQLLKTYYLVFTYIYHMRAVFLIQQHTPSILTTCHFLFHCTMLICQSSQLLISNSTYLPFFPLLPRSLLQTTGQEAIMTSLPVAVTSVIFALIFSTSSGLPTQGKRFVLRYIRRSVRAENCRSVGKGYELSASIVFDFFNAWLFKNQNFLCVRKKKLCQYTLCVFNQ